MKLICKFCSAKVNVTTSKDYVTKDGNIFCNQSCCNGYIAPRVKHNKKQKKKVQFVCPNCDKEYSFMTYNKKCSTCLQNKDLDVDTNIRLKVVRI